MVTIEEVDALYDEMIKATCEGCRVKDEGGFFGFLARKHNESKIEKIKKQGTYGRFRTLTYMRSILKELEDQVGYLPILHQNIYLSRVDLDFGPFAEGKTGTSTLYYEPSPYHKGELVCYDDTNNAIAWIRFWICDEMKSCYPVLDGVRDSKNKQIVEQQIYDGIDIALEKFYEAGQSYLAELKKKKSKGS